MIIWSDASEMVNCKSKFAGILSFIPCGLEFIPSVADCINSSLLNVWAKYWFSENIQGEAHNTVVHGLNSDNGQLLYTFSYFNFIRGRKLLKL